jgi:hypothetical protein
MTYEISQLSASAVVTAAWCAHWRAGVPSDADGPTPSPQVDCWWLIEVPSAFSVLTLWALVALTRGLAAKER